MMYLGESGDDKSSRVTQKLKQNNEIKLNEVFPPLSPEQSERKIYCKSSVVTRANASKKFDSEKSKKGGRRSRKRVHYQKVIFDGGEFEAGDDVYVKRRDDASSDDEDLEVEECRVCFKSGKTIMIECDDCLGGFHLKCLKPPMKEIPEGDRICGFCEATKMGKEVLLPKPLEGKKRVRTMREKLLAGDLWAAHIESLWKEVNDNYQCKVRWYIIPEETAAGRQPHNLKRELYLTNDYADIEP